MGSDSEANGWAQEVRAGLTAQVESKAGGVGVKDSVRQQIVNNAMHVQVVQGSLLIVVDLVVSCMKSLQTSRLPCRWSQSLSFIRRQSAVVERWWKRTVGSRCGFGVKYETQG